MSNKNQPLHLIDVLHLCRHFGIKRFKNSAFDLEFNENLPQMQPQDIQVSPEAALPTKDEAYEAKAAEMPPKVGADGLTAEQQRDAYGGVLDSELK